MPQHLMYQVFNPSGEHIASTAHVEDAAALLAMNGDDATIRLSKAVVLYTNGKDGNAGESYDAVATHVEGTLLGLQLAAERKQRSPLGSRI